MPRYPYRVSATVRPHLAQGVIDTLEHWVNHGVGETADFDLDEFWFYLLQGKPFQAARLGSPEQLAAMGWLMAELTENAPGTCFGSPEAVRRWRGLAESDPTLPGEG